MRMVAFKKKLVPILLTLAITMLVLLLNREESVLPSIVAIDNDDFPVWNFSRQASQNGQWRQLTEEQKKSLSKLGEMLYLNRAHSPLAIGKKYVILVWKYGKTLINRHVKHWTNEEHDPFAKCSVNNCKITYDEGDIDRADLVLFHLQRIKGPQDLPTNKQRRPNQYWTFLTDESPFNTFLAYKGQLKDFNNLFNWSMTYRMKSDIPVPYGRAVALNESTDIAVREFNEWRNTKDHKTLVAIMGSNCGGRNHRWAYVKELQKYMNVDVYGSCGKLKCPGHFDTDCPLLSKYLFYLAFENSNCPEYLTEKLWWNAYAKDSVPIIMGSSKNTVKQLLPPHSYIHVDEFASPRDLANYLLYVNATASELYTYYRWKSHFRIRNEHGYFRTDSVHYCRVCEALNYNEKTAKVYADLEKFWNSNQCYPSWDENN